MGYQVQDQVHPASLTPFAQLRRDKSGFTAERKMARQGEVRNAISKPLIFTPGFVTLPGNYAVAEKKGLIMACRASGFANALRPATP